MLERRCGDELRTPELGCVSALISKEVFEKLLRPVRYLLRLLEVSLSL
jgi:hypothetical protein